MLTPYVWSRELTGNYVQLVLGDRTSDKMLVKTLPALWYGKDWKGTQATAMQGACESPVHRKSVPAERPPLKKGQQVVATAVLRTLDMLRGTAGLRLPADRRDMYIDRLEIAALDAVDSNISFAGLKAIQDIVQQARWVMSNDV